jgi:hypothetical protein
VLAVQSVDTEGTDPAVSVEVLGNAVIRITASAALTRQTQFRYTISDGTRVATAGVTIVPVPPIVNRQPPVRSMTGCGCGRETSSAQTCSPTTSTPTRRS